jgi:hypothetical protein
LVGWCRELRIPVAFDGVFPYSPFVLAVTPYPRI